MDSQLRKQQDSKLTPLERKGAMEITPTMRELQKFNSDALAINGDEFRSIDASLNEISRSRSAFDRAAINNVPYLQQSRSNYLSRLHRFDVQIATTPFGEQLHQPARQLHYR